MHSCHSLIYMSFSDMMQGDNGNIKEVLGITSFTDYLAIQMIYPCVVVFCLYSVMALYNINNSNNNDSICGWFHLTFHNVHYCQMIYCGIRIYPFRKRSKTGDVDRQTMHL